MSAIEKVLNELANVEFETFEDLEEWLEENFTSFSGAEWPEENQLAFLVCDNKLLIVFEFRNGKWRFGSVEITAYAINEEEER